MVKAALIEGAVTLAPFIVMLLLFIFKPKWAFDEEEDE